MGTGNYSNGFREGIMIRGAGMFDAGYGRAWYVDAKTGADGNSGRRRDRPFLTMSKALTQVDSGDYIFFRGKVREQLSTPVGVFDVTIIGASTNPRHADDHSESSSPGRGSSAATWTEPASPTATTPLLTLRQQGWRFANFLFAGGDDAACVQLLRDTGSDSDERDASHAQFLGMRFDGGAGGLYGIQNNGGAGFVLVDDCRFYRFTETNGAGIGCTSTSVAVPLNWTIRNSFFNNNYRSLASSLTSSLIKSNAFGEFTSGGSNVDIAFNSSQGTDNVIVQNALAGTVSATTYVPGTGNFWRGNYSEAGIESGDPS